jgi:hypothetical protein
MYTTGIKNIGDGGKKYEYGELRIDEEEETIRLSQLKKSMLSSKMIDLGQIKYNSSTRLSISGNNLKIDDVSFDIDSTEALDVIKQIITKLNV